MATPDLGDLAEDEVVGKATSRATVKQDKGERFIGELSSTRTSQCRSKTVLDTMC